MTQEEFEEWRSHPYTEKFREAMERYAEAAKEQWIRLSWDQENPDPKELAVLKAQAEMAGDLAKMEYASVIEYVGKAETG